MAIKNIRYCLLLLFIFLVSISSHPLIMDLNAEDKIARGTILSPYIALVFEVLALLCLSLDPFKKSKVLFTLVFMFAFVIISYWATYAFYGTRYMLLTINPIFFSIAAIMVGWQMNMEEKNIYFSLLLYAGITLFVGLMQVYVNIGGFQILDQYEADNKNALGAMLAVAALIFYMLGTGIKMTFRRKMLFLLLFLATILVLLTIRARTAILSCAIIFVFLYAKKVKLKFWFIYIIIIAVIFLFFYYQQGIGEYIYNSFFQHHEDDITSDRMRRNTAGMIFLTDHFWLGRLDSQSEIGWIHNYPLERMYNFGFIFSFPILVLYLYLLVKTLKGAIKRDYHNVYNLGYYLLIILFLVSMAEPTFPFGPGTATIFVFILFGAALRNTFNEEMKKELEYKNNKLSHNI